MISKIYIGKNSNAKMIKRVYAERDKRTIEVWPSQNEIYGAKWDGSATTKWERTDAASPFSDPVPALSGGSGSSPFDGIMPWAGMVQVDDSVAGTLVAIPKFYYKWTMDYPAMKLQISTKKYDGFLTSPAHADRGDGKGERDIVYIGRYHCNSAYRSKKGVTPLVNTTRAGCRQGIHNLGASIWQQDYAMFWTIRMLYLVEFANWDSQRVLGKGATSSGSREINGGTDSMQYHTGTMAASRTDRGRVQYRNIEDLYGNCYEWCDGIYFMNNNSVYFINNPAFFSDSANGILLYTMQSSFSAYVKNWSYRNIKGYEYALFPEGGGSDSTYITDMAYKYTSDSTDRPTFFIGGEYSDDYTCGLFYWNGNGLTSSFSQCGSRLQKLP